jgi:hypothetical protein
MVLHKGEALALERLSKKNCRFAFGVGGGIKGREQR